MKRSVSTTERDDGMLVRDALAGDRRAFDLLVLRHGDMLFNLCFRMLGDYDEAPTARRTPSSGRTTRWAASGGSRVSDMAVPNRGEHL